MGLTYFVEAQAGGNKFKFKPFCGAKLHLGTYPEVHGYLDYGHSEQPPTPGANRNYYLALLYCPMQFSGHALTAVSLEEGVEE